MATLFERLVNPPLDPGPTETKIPLWGFKSLIREYYEGSITADEFFGAFNIPLLADPDPDNQRSDAIAIYNIILSSTAHLEYFEKLFEHLALGELGITAGSNDYRDATQFTTFVTTYKQ